MKVLLGCALLSACMLALSSCGDDSCKLVGLTVAPATATASHTAQAPDNQARFAANAVYTGACFRAACVDCEPGVTWSVSDPANVSLAASQSGSSAMVATCVGATNRAVTVTASKTESGKTVTGTAMLTCQ